jgi:hypothetical protein
MRTNRSELAALALMALLAACKTAPNEPTPTQEPAPASSASAPSSRLGAPVPAGDAVALAAVAKDPKAYMGKTVVTTGTVQAVCQHAGCWMTLKDEGQGDAFVRMAGHSFFIPKSASGKKARVHAKLVDLEQPQPAQNCGAAGGDHKMGCKEEAEKQTGKPLARLELEALGVELY